MNKDTFKPDWKRMEELVPIFKKMTRETEQRKADELAYKQGDYRPRSAS